VTNRTSGNGKKFKVAAVFGTQDLTFVGTKLYEPTALGGGQLVVQLQP